MVRQQVTSCSWYLDVQEVNVQCFYLELEVKEKQWIFYKIFVSVLAVLVVHSYVMFM